MRREFLRRAGGEEELIFRLPSTSCVARRTKYCMAVPARAQSGKPFSELYRIIDIPLIAKLHAV